MKMKKFGTRGKGDVRPWHPLDPPMLIYHNGGRSRGTKGPEACSFRQGAVADPGFPRGGGANIQFCQMFPKTA